MTTVVVLVMCGGNIGRNSGGRRSLGHDAIEVLCVMIFLGESDKDSTEDHLRSCATFHSTLRSQRLQISKLHSSTRTSLHFGVAWTNG